ncbi:hypothetical protein ABN764_20335 [Paenibacillaceae sp. P-4]|uniref:hypothetical protein n=1 Tax=Paenibacillaceae bacterium P-4 TaxID=3160969 RepID=UPI0032E821FD
MNIERVFTGTTDFKTLIISQLEKEIENIVSAARKGYICGTYARHGNIACTNHAVKEQNLTEVILSDLKAMYDKLNLPDLDAKVKQRINANQKK